MPEIEVNRDSVVICGTIVPRPLHICPSQWLGYWELAIKVGEARKRAYR